MAQYPGMAPILGCETKRQRLLDWDIEIEVLTEEVTNITQLVLAAKEVIREFLTTVDEQRLILDNANVRMHLECMKINNQTACNDATMRSRAQATVVAEFEKKLDGANSGWILLCQQASSLANWMEDSLNRQEELRNTDCEENEA